MKAISIFIITLLLGFSSCVPASHVSTYDPSYGSTVVTVNPISVYRPWTGWYYQNPNPTLVQPYLGNVYYRPTPLQVRPVRVTVPIVVKPKYFNGPRGGRRGR